MKKVLVFTSLRGGMTTLETQANNWGEFKQELISEGLMSSDGAMKAAVRELGISFDADSTELPVGKGEGGDHDFSLFLSPIKTKSGLTL